MGLAETWTKRTMRAHVILTASWDILKHNAALLLFPLASSLYLLTLGALYAVPILNDILIRPHWDVRMRELPLPGAGELFLLYLAAYAVGIFFSAALASCVLRHFEGKSATIREGIGDAFTCLPQLLGWAMLSATVGIFLRTLERRSGLLGKLIISGVGLAWSVATFLVVPVLIAERKGPLQALEGSVRLLRGTWGENLLAGIGFGALYFLWSLVGWLVSVIGAGLIATHIVLAMGVMLLAVLYFLLLGLVFSTLSTIFDVVLYRYAKQGSVTAGFDRELLEASFASRPV